MPRRTPVLLISCSSLARGINVEMSRLYGRQFLMSVHTCQSWRTQACCCLSLLLVLYIFVQRYLLRASSEQNMDSTRAVAGSLKPEAGAFQPSKERSVMFQQDNGKLIWKSGGSTHGSSPVELMLSGSGICRPEPPERQWALLTLQCYSLRSRSVRTALSCRTESCAIIDAAGYIRFATATANCFLPRSFGVMEGAFTPVAGDLHRVGRSSRLRGRG